MERPGANKHAVKTGKTGADAATLLGDYLARVVLKGWRFRSGAWKSIPV